MRALTPPGRAGVAIYRFEPDEAPTLVRCLRKPDGRPWSTPSPGRPVCAALTLPDGAQDDVLVLCLDDGAVELHAHGAPAVAAALAREFASAAAPPPSPAQQLLRSALGPTQVQLALEQIGCDFERELAAIAGLSGAAQRGAIAAARERTRIARAQGRAQPLHLIGRQNAGKSTLFNRLVGRERVLAGPTAGLTRDPVAETILLDGYPYEVWDHAGEGGAPAAVDMAAIERSRSLRRGGTCVLLVDAVAGPDATDRALAAEATIVLASRRDLPGVDWPKDIPCHARCSPLRDEVAVLRALLGGLLRRARGLPAAGPVGGFAALDDDQLRRLDRLAPG